MLGIFLLGDRLPFEGDDRSAFFGGLPCLLAFATVGVMCRRSKILALSSMDKVGLLLVGDRLVIRCLGEGVPRLSRLPPDGGDA